MDNNARYLFIARMNAEPARESVFYEVYDTEHLPLILKVPGVLSAKRYETVPLIMVIGGQKKSLVAEGAPLRDV